MGSYWRGVETEFDSLEKVDRTASGAAWMAIPGRYRLDFSIARCRALSSPLVLQHGHHIYATELFLRAASLGFADVLGSATLALLLALYFFAVRPLLS